MFRKQTEVDWASSGAGACGGSRSSGAWQSGGRKRLRCVCSTRPSLAPRHHQGARARPQRDRPARASRSADARGTERSPDWRDPSLCSEKGRRPAWCWPPRAGSLWGSQGCRRSESLRAKQACPAWCSRAGAGLPPSAKRPRPSKPQHPTRHSSSDCSGGVRTVANISGCARLHDAEWPGISNSGSTRTPLRRPYSISA